MVKAAATELDWRAGSPALLLAQLGLENLPAGQAALLDKKPRERWLVAVWLSALADELVYPLRVHSSERPDFLIQGPGQSIGVECMEVVPEELKRLQAELLADHLRIRRTDAVDVAKGNENAFVGGDVHACNARHVPAPGAPVGSRSSCQTPV